MLKYCFESLRKVSGWNINLRARGMSFAVIGCAVAASLGLAGLSGVGAAHSSHHEDSHVRPSGAASVQYSASSAFTFTPTPPSSTAVPESQAVAAARQYAQALPPPKTVPAGVTESVYYGNYADQSFSSRPVWLVEYTGTGVSIGDEPAGKLSSATGQYDHAEVVAIDAITGQLVDETTTNPQYLPAMNSAPVARIRGKTR